jgi:hypothetical protein
MGGTYDLSLSTSRTSPLNVVEAFSPGAASIRQVFRDSSLPRVHAAGAVLDRGVCICGGAIRGSRAQGWLNSCLYFDIDSQAYREVHACSRETYVSISTRAAY